MNLFINSNNIVIPESINFIELVKNSNMSLNHQSKIITILNKEFTEQESKWYIANLYMYLNYDSTTDYPINLENVFKMIGFANKGNAMKTIKSNFIKDEDYKTFFPNKKQKTTDETRGGHNKEDIMLNIDTFKNLCMIAKTNKGKEIRRYYVKLENIHNRIIKEEIEQQKIELEEQANQHKIELQEKDKYIAELKKQEAVSHLYKIV